MEANPKEAIDAVVDAKPITLARLALLEKAKCKILDGDIDTLHENIRAAYLYQLPLKDAVKAIPTAEEDSLVWVDGIGEEKYREVFTELVKGVSDFFAMLPPAKKKTGTDTASATDG